MMRYSSEYRRKVHMKNEICKKGFTDFQLKWIALVLMVMDHIHYFFEFTRSEERRVGKECRL